MKICIVTGPWLPVPPLQGGAVERRWQGVAEAFAAKEHQISILCRSYKGQPQQEIINGVKYFRYVGFPQSRSISWDLFKDLIYALLVLPVLPHADIFIINDFWLPAFATIVRPGIGKTVINLARFPKGQLPLYAKVNRFVVPSSSIQQAIAEQYPAAKSRARVIPNPINTHIFSPSISSHPVREEKSILYVGRIHPEKGIHLLLDAFTILSKQLSQIKLRILGPYRENQGGGGEEFLDILRQKAQGLKVEFSEPIFDASKLAQVYRSADLFCYPSLAEKGESFGVAPLEAMASGLVPVVSDLACFKDFIEEGKTGYFFDHHGSDAAENLSSVLNSAILNWGNTSQMSVKAIQKAKDFSYEQIADLYLADFQELLQAKN